MSLRDLIGLCPACGRPRPADPCGGCGDPGPVRTSPVPWSWWPRKHRLESPDGEATVWKSRTSWVGQGRGRTLAPAPPGGPWGESFGTVDLGLDEIDEVAPDWWTEVLVDRGRPLGAVTAGQARFAVGWAAHLAVRERWTVEWEVDWSLRAEGRTQRVAPRRWLSTGGESVDRLVPDTTLDILLSSRSKPDRNAGQAFMAWAMEYPAVSARLVQQVLVGLGALPRPGYTSA
jgi:hypothetical protein